MPWLLGEVEGLHKVAGLRVPGPEGGDVEDRLDELNRGGVLGERVVDEPVLCERRDYESGDPEPQAILVHLRGRDVVIPAAVVVPGEDYGARRPILALHD